MITAEDLREEIANLERQRNEYLVAYQQAVGALQLAHAMLARLDDSDLTVDQFAEMIGGAGSTATIVPNGEDEK